MARILHVEDDPKWRDLIRTRLRDHHVDSAQSQVEALDYLQSRAPYDLALVDLNLTTDSDLGGGDVLDLLRENYPATRRIVVTGSPPAGSVRANVFGRFHVEEIIIKGEFDTPDLRRAVEEALARPPSGLPWSLRLRRSELRQRCRDWQRRESGVLRDKIRIAEEHVYDAARVSEQTRRRAENAVAAAKATKVAFEEDANRVRAMLNGVGSAEDLARAAEALDAAEERFVEMFDGEDLG